MVYQQPNFDFIAKAGEQVAEGITAFETAKKMRIDDAKAGQAHQMLLDQAKQEYMQATGSADTVKATAFAARYFQPKFNGETALAAVDRWEKADTSFKSALASIKAEKQKTTNKATVQDVSAQLRGELPQRAMDSIKSGTVSLEDINKNYGLNLTQDQYDAHAGFGIMKGSGTGNMSSKPDYDIGADGKLVEVPQRDKGDATMATPNEVDAAKFHPISYQRGRDIVDTADLPAADKKQFDPNLESMADRDIGKTPIEGQTAENYFSTIQRSGYPLTENSKKVGDAILNEDKLAQKRLENERKARGAQQSVYQSLLKNWTERMKQAHTYGKDQEAAATRLSELIVARNNLDAELTNAQNYIATDPSKPAPDPATIIKNMMAMDNEIDRVKSTLPGFDRMVDEFRNYPSTFRTPITAPTPGPILPNAGSTPAPAPAPTAAPRATSSTRTKYGY